MSVKFPVALSPLGNVRRTVGCPATGVVGGATVSAGAGAGVGEPSIAAFPAFIRLVGRGLFSMSKGGPRSRIGNSVEGPPGGAAVGPPDDGGNAANTTTNQRCSWHAFR